MSRLFAIPPVSPLRSRIATGLVAVLLALLLVPSAAILAADNDEAKKKAGQPSEEEILLLMRMFSETFEQIERNYVKGIDRRRLVEAAIRGMLKELDQYSNYISPDQISRFQQSVSQQFGGIGIQVRPDLVVATPLAGSPAYKAGIKAGDRIVEIDGKQASTFPENRKLETAVSLMKGKAGDPVTLGIRRTGVKDVIKITVKRAIVQVPTVMGDAFGKDDQWRFMLDDKQKIGYVRLTHFARRTADELSAALGRLKKQGMKALVIDLRFNPGGLLSQATRISDMFIDKGRIVSTKGRNVRERIWDATKPGTHSGFPIAILVNHFSASASEILSACLQDHKRAVIVGERTWGKGSVQNVIQLEGGSSALKLTTASYHRPSGRNIHRFPNSKPTDVWGVMPDKGLEVKMSRLDMIRYQEYRRKRDVIQDGGPPKSDFVDSQLAKAVAHLNGTLNPKPKDKKKGDKKKPKDKKKGDKKKPKDKKKDDKKKPKGKKKGDKKKPEDKKKSDKKKPTGNNKGDKPEKKTSDKDAEQSLRFRPPAAPSRVRGLPLFRLPDPVG